MRRIATWLLPMLCVVMVHCNAATATGAGAQPSSIAPEKLDSPAATMIKKIPKDVVNSRAPKRFSQAELAEEIEAALRNPDEIRVFANRDPEDVVRKPTAFAQFRNKLEKDRPMTPAEVTKAVICFITGACAMEYGPDGAPIENTAYSRSERKIRSTLESSRMRGTLQ